MVAESNPDDDPLAPPLPLPAPHIDVADPLPPPALLGSWLVEEFTEVCAAAGRALRAPSAQQSATSAYVAPRRPANGATHLIEFVMS
jgi:hypothetical protein